MLFAIVIGWGLILDHMIKTARVEAGLFDDKVSYSTLRWASFIPIIAITGFCFPRIFLGSELVCKLREQGLQRRWFSRIRMAVVSYLILLIGVPVTLVLAGFR